MCSSKESSLSFHSCYNPLSADHLLNVLYVSELVFNTRAAKVSETPSPSYKTQCRRETHETETPDIPVESTEEAVIWEGMVGCSGLEN